MKLADGIIPFSPEWENARIGRLTASFWHKIATNGQGAGNLLSVGGLTYLNQKIGEILTQISDEGAPDTEDVVRGQALEPWMIERYSEITGREVHESRLFEYNAIAAGTTDGQLTFGDDPNADIEAIIEAKAPKAGKFVKILAVSAPVELLKIDPQYYHQPQANMLFTNSNFSDFIAGNEDVRNRDLQIRIIRIYPDLVWRKDCHERINWIADYMSDQLEKIMLAPERNLAYKTEKQIQVVGKLKAAIQSIQEITN